MVRSPNLTENFFYFKIMTKKKFSSPDSLIEWADEMATTMMGEMDPSEYAVAIQEVVAALVHGKVIEPPTENENSTLTMAAQTLYVCQLIVKIFPKAYDHAATRVKNIEQLNKSLEF